ncbi:hypothetical protein WA158_004067 [Blastocystis sp. Blastoise]
MKRSDSGHSEKRRKSRFDIAPEPARNNYRSVKDILFNSMVNPLNQNPLSQRYFEILKNRAHLPVFEFLDKIESSVENNQITIIEGETGSGKTTQIPQALLLHMIERGKSHVRIACTQPRRVAAMSVAKRVSEEMDVQLGQEVGYTVRFEDVTSPQTLLKYLTDGMLLREAMIDPRLTKYDVIILDEAHERTINTDILMTFIKEICRDRRDLRFILMSATLDTIKFQKYFDNTPILTVPGRLFPVEIFYVSQPEKEYVDATIRTIIKIHKNEAPGDILAFLTGEQEIMTAVEKLKTESIYWTPEMQQVQILPLFSSLPPFQQQLVFNPTPKGQRKIVLATNIAETSLTIDGVVYVIDCGFSKQKVYNPTLRAEYLLVTPISKVNAQQRAGRAGRTRPGKCFRLYTEQSYKNDLIEQPYPEIIRSDITSTVLVLKTLGVENLLTFDFMDPPASTTMIRALEQLNFLGALDNDGNLTKLGRLLSAIPMDPQLSKCLITSPQYSCVKEMIYIASLLSVPSPFLRPLDQQYQADQMKKQFMSIEGDHITLLNLFNTYLEIPEQRRTTWCMENFINNRSMLAANNIKDQLLTLFQKLQIPIPPSLSIGNPSYISNIRRCLCKGYFMQIAFCDKQGYKTVKDQQLVQIHPSSVLSYKPDWVLFHEFVFTTQHYIRTVTHIEPQWLIEEAPHYYDITNYPECPAKTELIHLYEEYFDKHKETNSKKE